MTGLFIHGIVIGCLFPVAIFVVRRSDCSTNGTIGLNDLMKMVAAGFVREWR
jgi:hypothetical protein